MRSGDDDDSDGYDDGGDGGDGTEYDYDQRPDHDE